MTLGAVASRLMVTDLLSVPPALVAEQVSVWPAVSELMVVGSHPVLLVMDDSGSLTFQLTVTLDVYQPFWPCVPWTSGVITGAVVSQFAVVHVTFMGSVRVIVSPELFKPVALYVTVPEPAPATDELTFTVEDTLSLSAPLPTELQFEGSVIVFGDAICALRPAPVTEAVTVTVAPFAKVFVAVAFPCRVTLTSAVLLDSTPEHTEPMAMLLLLKAAMSSPSETALSARAIAGTASSTAHVIKRSVILPLR